MMEKKHVVSLCMKGKHQYVRPSISYLVPSPPPPPPPSAASVLLYLSLASLNFCGALKTSCQSFKVTAFFRYNLNILSFMSRACVVLLFSPKTWC